MNKQEVQEILKEITYKIEEMDEYQKQTIAQFNEDFQDLKLICDRVIRDLKDAPEEMENEG